MDVPDYLNNNYPIGIYCHRTGVRQFLNGEPEIDIRGVVVAVDGEYVLVMRFEMDDASGNEIFGVLKKDFYAKEANDHLWSLFLDEPSMDLAYAEYLDRHKGEEPFEV